MNHARLEVMPAAVRDHLNGVGANDVGKTSLMRLFNLLLGSTVQQSLRGAVAERTARGRRGTGSDGRPRRLLPEEPA